MKNLTYRAPQIDMTSLDAAYVILSNMTSFLSCSGALVIIACYVSYRGIRTTSRLLLVYLSVADVILATSSLLQTGSYYRSLQYLDESSFLCQAAAGLWVYGQVCVSLWTVSVTVYLCLCVAGRCITAANKVVFLFHAFCWIMPFVVSLAADISGVYGYNQGDDVIQQHHPTPCWLSDRVVNPLPWYLLTVEGWVIAAFVIVSVLYIPISAAIYCKKTEGKEIDGDDVIEQLAIQTANEQLRYIPVIYVCTRLWGTGYFLFTRYAEGTRLRSYDWLLIIKAIGDNSQGLVNAIFFCLATKQIRKIISTRIKKFFCCCFGSGAAGSSGPHRFIGSERWLRVPTIVRQVVSSTSRSPRHRNLDGSDLDLTGINLDLPPPGLDTQEDDVIFER